MHINHLIGDKRHWGWNDWFLEAQMKFILLALLCCLPKFALADEDCQNPTILSQFDFKKFEYKRACEYGYKLTYSQLSDKLITAPYPREHNYTITIRLHADHTADIVNRDNIWYYTTGGGYTYWDKFKTTWTSNDHQIFINDVGTGVAIKCANSTDPVLSFTYDPNLQGLLAGKQNRIVSFSETIEMAEHICK
jgi:hypothetical protein